MAYSFVSQLKTGEYKNIIAYSIRYVVSDKYNEIITYSKNDALPNWYETQIETLETDILNKQSGESNFVQTDELWKFKRYRNAHEDYNESYTHGFHNGIINSRIAFIDYALSDIDIVPNSLEITEDNKIVAKGKNDEKIRLYKQTRGIGDTEELGIIVESDYKSVEFSNCSSLYTKRHIIEGKPDVYEEEILSKCKTHGYVNTPNGLYIFNGDYEKKEESDNVYYPKFSVAFYSKETIDILVSDLYTKNGKNVIREELNKKRLNSKYIQALLNDTGIVPDNTASIYCTNYDLVTFSKMFYNNPEIVMQMNNQINQETQYTK